MMLIDTHCHLDAPEFAPDRAQVVARARAAGVEVIVNPSVAARTFADTVAMREQFGCLPAFGLHPIYLGEHRDEHLDLLRDYLIRERAVAVGEIGQGRTLAFTSDPAPHWGLNFVFWEKYNQFWINVVDWLVKAR